MNEAVAALIDAIDESYAHLAHRCAVDAANPSIARRDYRRVEVSPSRPEGHPERHPEGRTPAHALSAVSSVPSLDDPSLMSLPF